MDISLTYRRNTHLAAVYFNNEAPNMFRIYVDATLVDLKQQLDEINRCCNNRNDDRTVTSVEYRKPSLRSDGTVAFSKMQLDNDDDIRNMFSIYSRYSTKGPIELDAKLTRSVDAILANLKHPDDEDSTVNLADP
jgi:pyruvate-formate lyase-activating enzyme